METVKRIENTIAGWLKPLPHLPENGRKWLADNVWWIVLIGAILSVLAAFAAISALLYATAIISTISSSFYGTIGYGVYNAWDISWLVISVLFLVANIVVMAMAVNPLKGKELKGWNLLFLLLLISAASSITNILVHFNIFTFISSLIFAALGLAIGAYFTFEIKPYFKRAK